MRKQIFVILCSLYLLQCYVAAQEACSTPNRQAGTCIPLRECSSLYQLLSARPLTEQNRLFLANSQCAFRNRSPYVCCSQGVPTASGPVSGPKPFQGASGLSVYDLPPRGTCGSQVSYRIVGGRVTSIYEYPWMALLEYEKPGGARGFHCGGVLIHPSYVLTASHCVNGRGVAQAHYRLMSVRLGEWDISKEIDCNDDDICAPRAQDIPIEELIPHEGYAPSSQAQQDDIALLRLSRPAQLNDFVRTICLPVEDQVKRMNFDFEPMNVVGWGKTENASKSSLKLAANVLGVPLEQCNRVYNSQNVRIGPKQVCAGGEKGVDSCNGDSGGPLMAQDTTDSLNPIYYLAGVVSFGPRQCGMEGWPGVYTRVSSYTDWILSRMRA